MGGPIKSFCLYSIPLDEKIKIWQCISGPFITQKRHPNSSSKVILPSATHWCNNPQPLPISSAPLLPLPPNEAQVGHWMSFTPVPLKKCWLLTSKGELHWNSGKESLERLSPAEKSRGNKDGAILPELDVGCTICILCCWSQQHQSTDSSGHRIQLQWNTTKS